MVIVMMSLLPLCLDSCTPFRYDPNDLSMEDDVGVSNVGSAIKNLNFSRIASAEDSGDSTSREKKLQHHYRQRQKTLGRHSPVSSSSLAGGGMKLDVAGKLLRLYCHVFCRFEGVYLGYSAERERASSDFFVTVN